MAGLLGYDGSAKWTPQDDRVDSEVARITDQGGPLMRQAQAQGLQQASKRGLLNSSLAVGASQQAVYNTAMPMASQNASQTAAKNLSAQGAAQDRTMSRQNYEQEVSLAAHRGEIEKDLTQTRGEWDSRLGWERSQQQRTMQDSQLAAQELIARMNVGAHDRQYAMSALMAGEQSYMAGFQAVASNQDIPAEVRNAYLGHLGAIRDSSFRLVEQMYGISVAWPSTGGPVVRM